jgi:alkylation response protein AidB-like acyl-CoA dehydrogenase
MDFSYSTEHEQVRDMVRRFCQTEIAPLVAQAEETETFPVEIFRKWGDLGLLGLRYPEADGGAGMDKVADCIVREELSAVSQAFATSWSAHTHLALWPIWRVGTADQKQRYLKQGLAGSLIGAFALSEPDTGSNIRELTAKAEKVAGGYRLRGSKLYISNAPIANFLLVAARTRPELTSDAISLFIVDVPNSAVSISKLKKEGIRGSETGLIQFDDVFVPDDALLGGREGTYPIILDSLTENRVGVSANAVGMARGAFEAALDFAKTRLVSGKPILRYQAVNHRLADMAAEIDAARCMVLYGAYRVDRNSLDAATAAKVKLIATEMAVRVTENAIRVLGGAGIMREYSVGRFHRDALVYIIGDGTSDIQRNIIARSFGQSHA